MLMPFAKQSAFLVDYSKKSQEGQAMRSNIFWVLLFEMIKHNGLVNTSKAQMRVFSLSLTICIKLLQLHDMIHFTLAEV